MKRMCRKILKIRSIVKILQISLFVMLVVFRSAQRREQYAGYCLENSIKIRDSMTVLPNYVQPGRIVFC